VVDGRSGDVEILASKQCVRRFNNALEQYYKLHPELREIAKTKKKLKRKSHETTGTSSIDNEECLDENSIDIFARHLRLHFHYY
jgi:hypothetical protein